MQEQLTAQELQDLKQKLAAMPNEEVLEQQEYLEKLFEMKSLQGPLSQNFQSYHAFWTELLNAELVNREIWKDE